MEKIKRRRGIFFFYAAITVVSVVIAAGYVREIRGSLESMDQCRAELSGMRCLSPGYVARLEHQAMELRDREATGAAEKTGNGQALAVLSAEGRIGAVRDSLRSHNIAVDRLRTTVAGGTGSAEFTLSCDPVNFFSFLRGAPTLSLPISYASIKPVPGSPKINVTVRFNYAP